MKPDRDSIHRRAIRLGAATFLVGLGLGRVSLGHELDEIVTQAVHEDLAVAGQTVTVAGRIDGDVMAAGERVTLSGALLDVGLVTLVLGLGALVLRRHPTRRGG